MFNLIFPRGWNYHGYRGVSLIAILGLYPEYITRENERDMTKIKIILEENHYSLGPPAFLNRCVQMATLNLRLDCSFLRFKTLRDQIHNSTHFARDMKILFTSILPVLSQVLLPVKNVVEQMRRLTKNSQLCLNQL